MAKFAVFLVAKILKMHIFLTFLNGYIHLTTSKTKNKPLGLCPKPHSHLRGRRGRWQTLSTYPYGECWSRFKASRVKCTTSSPLTPLHLRGVAKLTEADGAGNLSRLAKQPRSGRPLRVGGDPTLCGKGAGGFPAPLPRGERGCGQRPRCWQDPWGRAVGKMCRRHSF